MSGSWDYVVVGGGSAGCVLANRLSADPDLRVLLLEAGSDARPLTLRVPALTMRIGREHDWLYPADDDSRGNPAVSWSSGKTLGGGSAVNAMLWVRGHPADFDGWAREGCTSWDYASVLPYFRKGETFEGGADAFRGGNGPQAVSWNRVSHPLIDSFIDAAVSAGYPFTPDYNGAAQEGVSPAQASQRKGMRASSADAYLRPVRRRKNLTVVARAVAQRLVIEGGRCVGVEYRRGGSLQTARAEREVVVSAGAIGSPKLLMLSGIGAGDELRRLGIGIEADLPGVGRNLQEQPCVSMTYRVTERTLNQDVTPLRAARHGLDYLLRRRGAIASSLTHAVVFSTLSPTSAAPDFQLIYSVFATMPKPSKDGGNPDLHAMTLPKDPLVTVRPTLLHPEARGSVRLRSTDPAEPPLIEHRMLSCDRDVEQIAAAAERAREIFRSAPMIRHVVAEARPGPDVSTSADWRAFIRSSAYGIYHASGTCKMGVDDLAVVDPELRVRGVDGLRVADASIMPLVTSGNTNAPTMMIAERAADLVRRG